MLTRGVREGEIIRFDGGGERAHDELGGCGEGEWCCVMHGQNEMRSGGRRGCLREGKGGKKLGK